MKTNDEQLWLELTAQLFCSECGCFGENIGDWHGMDYVLAVLFILQNEYKMGEGTINLSLLTIS